MITYIKGDLFSSPKGSYLCHACNVHGKWLSGIAKTFKELFPKSYEEHQKYCKSFSPEQIIGTSIVHSNQVVALFTSRGYGSFVDPPEKILENTYNAFHMFLKVLSISNVKDPIIAMPKINSGLFKTPWEETEKVLLNVLSDYSKENFKVNVYEL